MTGPSGNEPRHTQYYTDAEAQYQAKLAQTVAVNPIGVAAGVADYANKTAQFQREQAAALQSMVHQHRPAVHMPGTYYLGYDHPAMQRMVNDDVDPAQVHDTGRAYNEIGNSLVDGQAVLTRAVSASEADWQGDAGDAARGFLGQLAAWTGAVGTAAQLAGNRMAVQGEAVERAKNSMPEPSSFDMGDAVGMMLSEPNPFKWAETADRIEQQFAEKQRKHEEAARVMDTMATSFRDSGATMPAFTPPPTMDSGSDSSITTTQSSVQQPNVRQPNVQQPTAAQPTPHVGDAPVTTRPDGDTSGTSTHLSNVTGTTPQSPSGTPAAPTPGSGNTSNLVGVGPVPPSHQSRQGQGQPPRPGTSGSAGGQAAGKGGVSGRGLAGVPGPGAVAGKGAEFGARMPGGSSGVLAAEQQAARGATAGAQGGRGAGAPGAMGGMGAGAAKGEGGEDQEHQRKIMIEEDGDELFGLDTMVAPPTIGE